MMYETIIRNGRIIDGSGAPWFRGDVAIDNSKIVKIGVLHNDQGRNEIDAEDSIVCPGFIDTHTHYDMVPFPFGEFINPRCEEKLLQGISTLIVACCGNSMAPLIAESKGEWLLRRTSRNIVRWEEAPWLTFAEYLSALDACELGTNFASYVGHTTLRFNCLGTEDRPPSVKEMEFMKTQLREAMEDGAIGMSSGLPYAPAVFSSTEELIELASVLKEFQAPFACHLREETWKWIESVEELIQVAEANHIPGQVHHIKVKHPKFSSTQAKQFVQMVNDARERGVDITGDLYPYDAGCIGLETLILPAWVREGNEDTVIGRLSNPSLHGEIRKSIYEFKRWENEHDMEQGFSNMMITIAKNNEKYHGRNILDVAQLWNIHPIDAAIKLIVDSRVTAMTTYIAMKEEDIKLFMKMPEVMIGSDSVPLKEGWSAHPRTFGTHAKIIRKYVLEDKILSLEDAIYKMTGLPATRFRFTTTGFIKEGFRADIAIFNPFNVTDHATYEHPTLLASGIDHLFVNGVHTISNGHLTGNVGGRVIRRGE